MTAEACQIVGYYEYLLSLLYVRWTVRAANDRIRMAGTPSVSEFGITRSAVVECARHMNRSVFGVPVLLNYVGGHLADIVIVAYYHVLFRGVFINYKKNVVVAVAIVFMKLADVSLLYAVCSYTTKEVRYTCLSSGGIASRMSVFLGR